VFQNSTAKNSERLMLLAIADSINDDTGTAWPSVETLAAKVNVKERQAQNLIQALEELGELHVKRSIGRRHTSTYQIVDADKKNIITGEKVQSTTPFASAEKVQCSAEKVQCSAEKVQYVAPDPIIPIEPKTTPTPTRKDDYFGLPRPKRREQVIADGYTQDAAKAGVGVESYRGIVDALLDAAGLRALVEDGGDDASLNYAKRDALSIIRMGVVTVDMARAAIEACKAANNWREDYQPRSSDIAKYVSQLKQKGKPLPAAPSPTTNGVVSGFDFSTMIGGA